MTSLATSSLKCNIVPAGLNNDIDARLAFLQRASAQLALVEESFAPIDQAFDALVQPFAEIVGLPACDTCGGQPCANESFCSACRIADQKVKPPSDDIRFLRRLLADDVSFDRAQREILRRRGA